MLLSSLRKSCKIKILLNIKWLFLPYFTIKLCKKSIVFITQYSHESFVILWPISWFMYCVPQAIKIKFYHLKSQKVIHIKLFCHFCCHLNNGLNFRDEFLFGFSCVPLAHTQGKFHGLLHAILVHRNVIPGEEFFSSWQILQTILKLWFYSHHLNSGL